MKFGKAYRSQMIQEWQTAYMDYHGLKILLKDSLKKNVRADHHRTKMLRRKLSLYRSFSGLHRKPSPRPEDEVILVRSVQPTEEHDVEAGGVYRTEFLMSADDDGGGGEEAEVAFFRKLDSEFNKVVKFYQGKMSEVKTEAVELTKQMDALIALRVRVDYPLLEFINDSTPTPTPKGTPRNGAVHMDAIEEGDAEGSSREESVHIDVTEEGDVEGSGRGEGSTNGGEQETESRGKYSAQRFRPSPLQVLNQVKINIDPETPVSTLKRVFNASKPELSFSKAELNKVQEKLKQVFVEFHRKLRLLKTYSFLNVLAFSKIMKKYDKVTSTHASKSYMKMVENSIIGNSDEITRITHRVEATIVKHFSDGKGMKLLRPEIKRERHRVTFFLGVFFGNSVALLVGILISIRAKRVLDDEKDITEERDKYMKTIFPLYSLFGYICLHLVLYSSNIFAWRHFRVNYPFIFGFNERKRSMGFRQILLVAFGLSVAALAGVVSNLDMEMNPDTESYSAITESVPLGLLIAVVAVLLCPFNILYRSSRVFLLRRAWHCLCVPLYKVSLPDFLLADQLTSQVQAFRCLLFYVVYYGWGYFKNRSNSFEEKTLYEVLYIIVAIIPFWSRFLQCLRRWVEEEDKVQLVNGFKYFSTIFALVMRTLYSQNRLSNINTTLKVISMVSGISTTVFNTYWDLVMDWGLLQSKSRNPWLRDKLLVPNKLVYFAAMVVNVLLRLVWMQMIFDFQISTLHRTGMTAIVACLEILRRGIWNFFRLENEHLNNVGKYRAFKEVPLPFFYEEGNGI